jgi:predicted enzyme related to lactoylglutathione lyase
MHWCFTVPDVEAALERIEAAGGKLFGDLRKYDDATQLYFRDPDGNLFELVSISLEELVGRTCLRTQAA